MDAWVERALAKWPNVPALYGWLGLSRRGRWLLQGREITHPRIVRTINRNYGCDDRGCWFFQNGPQRGYVELAYAPLILSSQPDGGLITHAGVAIETVQSAWLDEEGSVMLDTDAGPGLIRDQDLDWVLERLTIGTRPVDDDTPTDVMADAVAQALALASGARTELMLTHAGQNLAVQRCDAEHMPDALGFVRVPAP